MIEHERTFLAKGLPDLSSCEHEEMVDIYVPATERHPILRIRKKGEERVITKKSRKAATPQNRRSTP